MKKTVAFPRSHYQMEICLPEGKLFIWLTELLARRLFCNKDTAMCAHKLKWHSLAAPNSLLSQGILWHEGGTTKYCVCLSKMEGSWEFKRKFSCQLVLSKLGSNLKYQPDRYNCHHFRMQDGAFGSEIIFLQWTQLLSPEELINKQRMICAS